jgi:hypothetical protein
MQILLTSKLKMEKLFRNAEHVELILDVTYAMKLHSFKLKKSKLKHFKKTF